MSEPTGEIAWDCLHFPPETTDPGEAGDRLQELVLPTDRQAPITLNAATSSAKNPLLGALQLGRHREHLTATSQLAFRTGATHPRYPLPAKTPRASVHHLLLPEHTSPGLPLPLTRVPQVIWPGTLPGLDDSDPIVRAEISLLIAHLGTTRPWSHLTLDLGLPRTFHSALARRIRTRRAHGTWPTLLAQLDELLEHLQAHPPWPNYRHRRILADDLLLLERVLVTADPDQRLPALAVQRRSGSSSPAATRSSHQTSSPSSPTSTPTGDRNATSSTTSRWSSSRQRFRFSTAPVLCCSVDP